MIQDIFPSYLDNHYYPDRTASSESAIVCFKNTNEILMYLDNETDKMEYPRFSQCNAIDNKQLVYLFSVDGEDFFLCEKELKAPIGFSYYNIKKLRERYYEPKKYVYAAYTAYQLSEWYTVTCFCGKCGSRNMNDLKERARVCPKCGNRIYPRINPAVIIGVTDKSSNKLILTKYRTGFGHNALVAGFTEIGETLEETVKREVMEEVGLKITRVRYYKSQPWGIASDILAGFFCDVEGDPSITIDESELKYAEWVSPDDIELQPLDYSLTNEMMRLFKDNGYEGTINL